ncbi:hypothetical protein D7Y09_11255 [bacterium 1XD42-1]|nr:hypothetical protein D7Y09_11255 [bacterium 1XD42-1]
MNLSSFSVKRPVGLCMCVLSLIVFGISSVFSMKMESTPEMNMPVLMVRTSYSDASPEEVDQLVTDVIESALSQISDVDSMTSRSSEGSSMTMLEFDYSVDTSEKREDIEEALQRVRLPDSADDPVVMEMSMDSSTIMELSIQGEGSDKLMSYIDETIVPELEKINGVASVETMGGSRKYALATSIFLVFVVMAFQFESCRFSLVVMLSVPFSMTGAFLALSVTGMSISMTSLIGLIMLVGIVVNNAIVLIDYTSYLRKTQGMSPMDALIASGKSRLRPILMTTLTTILSLIPMAAGIGGKVEMMQSMAVVVIGGLSISTLLTLILVPTVYLIFDKQDRNRRKMEKGKNPRPPKHNRRDQALSLEQVPHEFQDNL